MTFTPKLLVPALMLLIASCAPSQTRPATVPTPNSSANSPTTSDKFVPCSSLTLGKVSVNDTTATLGWVLPLMEAVGAVCKG